MTDGGSFRINRRSGDPEDWNPKVSKSWLAKGKTILDAIHKDGYADIGDFRLKDNKSMNRLELFYNDTDDKFMAAIFDCVFGPREAAAARAIEYAEENSKKK